MLVDVEVYACDGFYLDPEVSVGRSEPVPWVPFLDGRQVVVSVVTFAQRRRRSESGHPRLGIETSKIRIECDGIYGSITECDERKGMEGNVKECKGM